MKQFFTSRRIFLANVLTFFVIVIAGFIKFLIYPNKKGVSVVTIDKNNLRKGVNHFPEYSIIILNFDKIEILSDICTHLGCKVNFLKDKNIFQCPCHKSEYSIYGKVIKGPAKKDLKKLKFKIINNKIKIII